MSKTDHYRAALAASNDWDAYLIKHSGLPGPRANLELLQVAADLGDEARFKHWLTFDAARAPTGKPEEYLAACGAVGLGRLVAEGKSKHLTIRACASDPRWRVREGVALALQRWGDADMPALLREMDAWRDGNLYEQRAAIAAVCEPRLLRNPANAKGALKLLDRVTRNFSAARERKSDDFIALKKGLAYCWSVAVAGLPAEGKRAFEKWLDSKDPDVRRVMRDNLTKDRLKRMDAAWVKQAEAKLNE